MVRRIFVPVLALSLVACSGVAELRAAAPPSEQVLPATTKGYVSVPDLDLLRSKWNETQLGQLANDPLMQPFVEDLREQIQSRLSQTGVRVGLTWADLEGVYGGEVATAVIQPDGDQKQHALALLADVTGHRDAADQLLAKVARNMAERNARRSTRTVGDVQLTVFDVPPREGEVQGHTAVHFIYGDLLVATDHVAVAEQILATLSQSGSGQNSLAQLPAFENAMQRVQKAAGDDVQAHVRWFVEPFGYAEVARAAAGGRQRRGTDMLKVLSNQGFQAVEGMGGHVRLATEKHEALHHTMIYAPGTFELAARMLAFPNAEQLKPQAWVPQHLAGYLTFNWKVKDAFEYSKSLVNELVDAGDDDIFEDVLEGIKTDPLGPQVDIREELIRHLGQRASLLSDYRTPITPKSERLLFAIEVTDPKAVARTVNKAMESDPDAKKREFEGHVIWEILGEQEAVEVPTLKIDGPGFGPFGEEEPEEEEKPLLPNSAITVAHGQLIIASHVDFIIQLLKKNEPLADAEDYRRVQDALKELGAGNDSFRSFTRTDEAYRPTYELLRQGKMPESETMLGKVLNRIFGPDEEGVLRQQQIDAQKLPEYSQVRKYLGPSGLFVRTEQDGWFVAGVLLTQETDSPQPEEQPSGEPKAGAGE